MHMHCAAATDLLTDDYGLKRTLKVKHTTPQGVTFTVENEHKKGTVVGKITGKYVHKESGFALDKITLSPDGSKNVECALVNLADGLKLTAKVSSSTAVSLATYVLRAVVGIAALLNSKRCQHDDQHIKPSLYCSHAGDSDVISQRQCTCVRDSVLITCTRECMLIVFMQSCFL
jgi:hypothetical protein